MLDSVPGCAAVCLHRKIIPLVERLVSLEIVKPRQVLAEREINRRLRRLFTRRPLLHGFDHLRDGRPDVIGDEPGPVLERLVFQQETARPRVCYVILDGLAKDAVRHGVSQQAAQVEHANGDAVGGFDFGGEIFVGDGALEGDGSRDVKVPYCLKGEVVCALEM
jgi:hypothetical protein